MSTSSESLASQPASSRGPAPSGRSARDGLQHRAQAPFAVVAPLLRASLLLGVAGGFALATALTVTYAWGGSLGLWWQALAQAHGHLQLYGWAGLFVLGVAFHFLPRLLGSPLPRPHLILWIVGAQVAALVLRAIAQPLLTVSGAWRIPLALSAVLECAAIWTALALIFDALRRSRTRLAADPSQRAIAPLFACAAASLALAPLVNLFGVAAAPTSFGLVPATLDGANITLGLLGFLTPMALAMSARALPMYSSLDILPAEPARIGSWGYIAGLALTMVGIFTSTNLLGVGLVLLGAALALYVILFMTMMRRRGKLPQRVSRLAPLPVAAAEAYTAHVQRERSAFGPFVALVASAYLWALFGAVLLILYGLVTAFGGPAPFALDAARHALAVGFISLLICGLSPRMLPAFSGGRIASSRYVVATLWLGNLAALLRVFSILAGPALAAGSAGQQLDMALFGLSGPTGLALAVALALNLWPALKPKPAQRPA